MAYTKYGEFMRILRVRFREVMSDTAKMFNVKLPFVSAVESGKKNVPEEWIAIIVEHYHLGEKETRELMDAIEESKTQMRINLLTASTAQRRVAVQFQRSFDSLDEDTAEAILKLLHKEDS